MSEIFTLKLTKQELWILSENYAAAFTDPDGRNEVEISVSEKLIALSRKARTAPKLTNLPE